MKIYLVGGAVRDGLMGLTIKDHDWVVVGATPEEMIKREYQPVGKDFPVFLHPKTHEEYALARTERKSAAGYTGFICYASPEVTLVEDLLRRDLTINAMAFDFELFIEHYPSCKTPNDAIKHFKSLNLTFHEQPYLIDPYQGLADLNSKTLRHVSEAFTEDPLRILRLARFKARFAKMNFTLAPETQELIEMMVANGELNFLTKERIWQETTRALDTEVPSKYFSLLIQYKALKQLYPDFDAIITPHALTCLDIAAQKKSISTMRFAILVHNLFDADDNTAIANKKIFSKLCETLRIGNEFKEMTWLIAHHYREWSNIETLDAQALLSLFESLGVFRQPESLTHYCFMCTIIYQAYEPSAASDRKTSLLMSAFQHLNEINIQSILSSGLKGVEIKNAITQLRLETLAGVLNSI